MTSQLHGITTKVSGRTLVISIENRIDKDLPTAAEIAGSAVHHRSRIVILDLSKAPLINSEGLDWLDTLRALLEADGIRLRVVAKEGGKVSRILRLMQYDKVVVLLSSLADALRAGKRRTLRLLSRKKRAPVPEPPAPESATTEPVVERPARQAPAPPVAGAGRAKN